MAAQIQGQAMVTREVRDYSIPTARVQSRAVTEQDRLSLPEPFPHREIYAIHGNSVLGRHADQLQFLERIVALDLDETRISEGVQERIYFVNVQPARLVNFGQGGDSRSFRPKRSDPSLPHDHVEQLARRNWKKTDSATQSRELS
jgi:hypothetical protein